MNTSYDLAGIGIGPFNLSLASLLSPISNFKMNFFESKEKFSWHDELLFTDAVMQTSYLKDLVSSVDPTNQNSFINYLVSKGLFYQFLNTGRSTVSRLEFQDYCKWASENLSTRLSFNSTIEEVTISNGEFILKTNNLEIKARNICIGTGPIKKVPDFAKPFLSKNIFHAKSQELKNVDFENKRVLIIGGGQTGLEIFRNGLNAKWGKPSRIQIVSDRQTFQPLDESAFANDFFTPNFINDFFEVKQDMKDKVVESQKFMSDGNTPSYLEDFYTELYLDKYYNKFFCPYNILPMRTALNLNKHDDFYRVSLHNSMFDKEEVIDADIIIFATGFETKIPKCLDSICHLFEFDQKNRPILNPDYTLKSKSGAAKIYAMNFSRHCHGIADPQTSLMAYRSACIVNSLLGKKIYNIDKSQDLFSTFN